jgi:2-keto-4-pentenoate hydratase/2-oxohepta-3-ene-1,7-dioic acid hydratase in catechol pathway
MRLGTAAWRSGTSAILVEGDRCAFVAELPGRSDTRDVAALIATELTLDEITALRQRLVPLDEQRLRPPVLRPPKNVLCVGKNYLEHVHEGARAEGLAPKVPTVPIWFTKAHTALVGTGGSVVLDPAFTSQLDYEGELAMVIGRTLRAATRDNALDHVFGYTILNDVTARDVQQRHVQWFRGKSSDTFAPCGPWVVTADEIPDPQRLEVRTLVNGEIRQQDSTANMIFSLVDLLVDISASMTLEPGDIIGTGTPQGVAWGMDEPRYLAVGDEVVVEVSGVGRLVSTVAAPDQKTTSTAERGTP